MIGIRCPACTSKDVCVRDSRPGDRVHRRRYACATCDRRFTTLETIVEQGKPMVLTLGGAVNALSLEATLARSRERILSTVRKVLA